MTSHLLTEDGFVITTEASEELVWDAISGVAVIITSVIIATLASVIPLWQQNNFGAPDTWTRTNNSSDSWTPKY